MASLSSYWEDPFVTDNDSVNCCLAKCSNFTRSDDECQRMFDVGYSNGAARLTCPAFVLACHAAVVLVYYMHISIVGADERVRCNCWSPYGSFIAEVCVEYNLSRIGLVWLGRL